MGNSKILFWIVIVFSILNLLDVFTAMFILPGESNPIYSITGSILSLWIIKILFVFLIFFIYFKNEYPNRFWYYSFVYTLIIGSLVICFGIYSNLQGILNPKVLRVASELTSQEKTSYYFTIMGWFVVLPYIVSMVSFKIFQITENKIGYNNEVKRQWDSMLRDKK